MAVFEGAGVAIVTPMKANGEVNYDKFGEIIDFQVENGTDSIIVCGTTGEASTLTYEEHIECIRYTVDRVHKRIPVIAVTANAFVDDKRQALESGMDAHIAKPVQVDTLKATIQQVLDKKAL